MTETQPIGLADIAAISTAEEGKACALALFNQLQAVAAEINCNDDGTPFRDEFGRVFIRPAGQESTTPGPWVHWRGER